MEETLNNAKKIGSKVTSVSLTWEDYTLCNELNISLSGILRAKIQEIRENSADYARNLRERDEKIKRMHALIQQQAEKIERYEEKEVIDNAR